MPTLSCEGFDTVKQKWFKMESIDKPRHSTSAIVMNNNAIYIMPGSNSVVGNNQAGSQVEIFMLDLKQANRYSLDDLNYIKALACQKWSTLYVQDPHFNQMPPTACLAINAVEMLIFGGQNQRIYSFNISDMKEDPSVRSSSSGNTAGQTPSSPAKIAGVKPLKNSCLRDVADFCRNGDVFGRVF